MNQRLNISFFGSNLVSRSRNSAAKYYLGLTRALAERGHRITFYEPDALDRQKSRDKPDLDWARVVAYKPTAEAVFAALEKAEHSNLIIKCSGVGVFDELLEAAVLELKKPETLVAFLDRDAPATLRRIQSDPEDAFLPLIREYDFILTCDRQKPINDGYLAAGATECAQIHNALDPHTHFPIPPDARFRSDLGFLADRVPDYEARLEELFLRAATKLPQKRFLLGGSGWQEKGLPENVHCLGQISESDQNIFNSTAHAVLTLDCKTASRQDCIPPMSVLEAAGVGACVITDKWEGLEQFLEPNTEVLVAGDGDEVAAHLEALTPERANQIGEAAKKRILAQHTYAHRARQLEKLVEGKIEKAFA